MNKTSQSVTSEKTTSIDHSASSMQDVQRGFRSWIWDHKELLLLAGLNISIIDLILRIKDHKTLINLWKTLSEYVKRNPVTASTSASTIKETAPAKDHLITLALLPSYSKEACNVREHIRTMAANRHHSAKKATEAASAGIKLLPNQTLVHSYRKYTA